MAVGDDHRGIEIQRPEGFASSSVRKVRGVRTAIPARAATSCTGVPCSRWPRQAGLGARV